MNIKEEIARATHAWRDHAVDGTPLGETPICNCYEYAAHIMPLVKRAQADAWDQGVLFASSNRVIDLVTDNPYIEGEVSDDE